MRHLLNIDLSFLDVFVDHFKVLITCCAYYAVLGKMARVTAHYCAVCIDRFWVGAASVESFAFSRFTPTGFAGRRNAKLSVQLIVVCLYRDLCILYSE